MPNLRLLLASPLDAQQREYATALRSAGDTLLALVNDVLDLSKIEAGHLELESQPIDPRQLVGEPRGRLVEGETLHHTILIVEHHHRGRSVQALDADRLFPAIDRGPDHVGFRATI